MIHRKRSPLAALTTVVLGFAPISVVTAACPVPTKEVKAECVILSDIALGQTLELASALTLNCRGHRLLPLVPGLGTTPESYVPSVPAAAIAITAGHGVMLRNCIIGDDASRFDFGVIAMKAKNAGSDGYRIR